MRCLVRSLAGVSAVLVLGTGCAGTFKNIGNDLGAGLGKGLLAQVDTDGPKAVGSLLTAAGDGVRTQVLNDATKKEIAEVVTTAVNAAGDSAKEQLPQIREQILNAQTNEELRKMLEALLKQLDRQAQLTSRGIIREASYGVEHDLMSMRNQERLNEILASLGRTATDQTTVMKNQLLTGNDEQVKVIVGAAMKEVVNASEEIRQKAHNELSFVQKNATESIVLALGLASIVVGYLWRESARNRRLLEVMMARVQQGGAGTGEAQVMQKIEEDAKVMGLERQLSNAWHSLEARFGGKEPPKKS